MANDNELLPPGLFDIEAPDANGLVWLRSPLDEENVWYRNLGHKDAAIAILSRWLAKQD